jgi:hypothetical protein
MDTGVGTCPLTAEAVKANDRAQRNRKLDGDSKAVSKGERRRDSTLGVILELGLPDSIQGGGYFITNLPSTG